MSAHTTGTADVAEKKHRPYVPENIEMKEFTLRAVLLGLFMTVVLGAANAYLGLRAGITMRRLTRPPLSPWPLYRMERDAPRREHRANRGIDWRVGSCGCNLHDPGIPDRKGVAFIPTG